MVSDKFSYVIFVFLTGDLLLDYREDVFNVCYCPKLSKFRVKLHHRIYITS